MKNFDNMLIEIRKMQIPIITVTSIHNNGHNRCYIIIANGNHEITVFVFDDDSLVKVDHIDMGFHSAIYVYSEVVLNNPGSTFKLISL